jgi:hypothetical protein
MFSSALLAASRRRVSFSNPGPPLAVRLLFSADSGCRRWTRAAESPRVPRRRRPSSARARHPRGSTAPEPVAGDRRARPPRHPGPRGRRAWCCGGPRVPHAASIRPWLRSVPAPVRRPGGSLRGRDLGADVPLPTPTAGLPAETDAERLAVFHTLNPVGLGNTGHESVV